MSDQKTEFEQRVQRQDFQKVVSECHRIKGNAAEYVGQLGNYRKNQSERLGLNNAAFALFLRLDKLEPAKRQDFYRSLIQYAEYGGHLEQIDAFDDLTIIMERVLDVLEETPVSDNVVALDSLSAAE